MTFDEWWAKVEELNPPEILVGCRDLAEDAWEYQEQQLAELREENEDLRGLIYQLRQIAHTILATTKTREEALLPEEVEDD